MSDPLVIKIGGSTLGSSDTTFRDIAALAIGGNVPVVVHGGGAEATRWLEAMGIPSHFERGLRVTDEQVLPVVVAVFAGLVNKRIVSAINAAGATAVGLSGADGRILECRIVAPDLGFVGEPLAVHPRAITALREAGMVPVISPIGFVPGTRADQLVNVNADTSPETSRPLATPAAGILTTNGGRDTYGNTVPHLSADEPRAHRRSPSREG